jgi:hypothetical protein
MENKQKYVKMKKNKFNKKGATGLSPFIIGLITTLFFTFCIIGFSINFMKSQNPNSTILSSDYKLNQSYNNMTSTFNSLSGENGTISSLGKDLVGAQAEPTKYVFLMFQAAFEIPKAMINLVFGGTTLIGNVLYNSIVQNLGGQFTIVGGILTTSLLLLMAGLLFVAIFLVIKTIRTGESER